MTLRNILLALSLAAVACVGCNSGQDGELPKDDPMVGKPTDQGATKDTNAPKPSGGDKAGAPSKGGI